MRIGILSDIADNRGSGPGNIMYNLIAGVREESSHEIVWLHTEEAESDLNEGYGDIKISGNPLKSARNLRAENFDIIHMDCISRKEMAVYPFLVDSKFMATQFGDVHFAEKHIWPQSESTVYKKRWAQRILHRFHEAITVSSHSAKQNFVSGGLPEDKLHVVQPGLDKGYRGADQPPLEDRENDFFHVSYFQPVRKNPALLIEAFEHVREAGHDADLVIAGPGWEEDFLREHTDNPETMEHITLLGYVDHSDLKELYQNARAFVVPTRHEGFPIPPMEAMGCGTPVVSNDVYAVPETVGDAGILVEDPDDVEGFADAMISLLEEDDYWEELSKKSRERVEQLRWEDSAKRIADIYDSLN